MKTIRTLIIVAALALTTTGCAGLAQGLADGLSNTQLGQSTNQPYQYQQPQNGSITTFNQNGTVSQGYITTSNGYTTVTMMN